MQDRLALARLTQVKEPNADDYLHWDVLRRKEPKPEGFSYELWWTGLKIQRSVNRTSIPELVDANDLPFSFAYKPHDYLEEQIHRIDMTMGGNLVGTGFPEVSTEERDRYVVSSLVHEAITSSQLEGALTTREDAKQMLQTKRSPKDLNERMILNNYLTMREIHEWKSEPLSVELILKLHRMVTNQCIEKEEASGRFRLPSEECSVMDPVTGEVYHKPPAASDLLQQMEALCAFANVEQGGSHGFVHPVVRAIIVHFWLAYVHPFVDGNGRTARALFYWCMLRYGYWMFEYVSISGEILKARKQYYRAFLYTENDENDLNYFIVNQVKMVDRSITSLNNYITRKRAESDKLWSITDDRFDLNMRQRELVAHALKKPRQIYTITGHENWHEVSKSAARKDLMGLVDYGLLIKSKWKKELVFKVPENLAGLLKRTT